MAITAEDIKNMPPKYKLLLGVAGFVLIGYFYFFYFLQPALGKAVELKDNLGNLERQIVARQRVALQIEKHKKEIAQLKETLQMALSKLPEQKEIPGLLSAASKAGTSVGLEFILFEPMKPVPKEFYAEIPVRITVKGAFHNLAGFFDAVANLPRIITITDIKIGNAVKREDGENILTADCFLKTYMFLEQPDQKAEENQDEKAKKK
jgi:type IV pilus assembly protein PilO